ncbi:MAG: WD repeat domain phosphoinositide-interacting protein 3 [Vezdaea aestivalis]|nr:MAG: WD repeat domain phosphoinositide-interacting protein 3 [Vezdaea aestivalis]
MVNRANYVALVGGGKQPKFPQNKVTIWDDAKSQAAVTIEFNTPVLRVRLTRTRLVVALRNSIHIYAFGIPTQRLSVFETTDNPFGVCCLNEYFIAFPGRTAGQVQIMEIETKNVSIVPAHSNALRAIELSRDGELLATASVVGTLIRVFSTRNSAKITELRRGIDPAQVYSLAISPSGEMLAVTSDKSTLHIFDLPRRLRATSKQSQSPADSDSTNSRGWGFLSKLPLLPRAFSDVYSFASAHFEMGDEDTEADRPVKGTIGWVDDERVILIGTGRDARWEKFVLAKTDTGQRVCIREGWKRYLGSR